jgi:hypothetical protein
MSPQFSLSVFASLLIAGAATAADHTCSTCKELKPPSYIYHCCGCKTYYPPFIHPDTPFGYYPTCWYQWPGGATCPHPGCAVPLVPAGPAVNVLASTPATPNTAPLPPSRPADPVINPTAYRPR